MNLRPFFLTLLLMLGFSGARATDVGGDIGTDTLWTNAGSPYVVTSNLTVRATLRIESGVRVLVQPGKTILVTGDLLAEGVIFTSSRDQVGSNPAAAPGDWGPLINRLTNENFPCTSNLRGATLRFGKGLQLESASPQLGSLRLENHAAPAISADLRSNPTGDGIVATGNQINGIALPAGNADRGLTLRMRGIPYVITGKLSVGPNPISINPETLSMIGNQVSEAKVKLLDAAPEGGLSVSLVAAPPSVVTIPSSVVVQANQREAAFNITATQSGGTVITANANYEACFRKRICDGAIRRFHTLQSRTVAG